MNKLEEIKSRLSARETLWESPVWATSDIHWLISEVESLRDKLAALNLCDPMALDKAYRERDDLRQQLAAQEETYQALLKQNVQQEQELEEKDATICGMRKALEAFVRWYSINSTEFERDTAYALAVKSLSSSPTCSHKEKPTAASLVGTAPVFCKYCGGEINPDYGKCRRCG